jgi:hypothetical protein
VRRMLSATAAVAIVVASLLTWSTRASAHEQRVVGKYTIEAGWSIEPAIVDRPNAVVFEVKESATGRAVEGLEKTVSVAVSYGGLRATFSPPLQSVFNEAGSYVGDIVPTAAGDYTFRFTGKIEGLTIDEKFESGPGRFDPIATAADLQFPAKAASAADLTRQVADLQAAVDQARILAIEAVVLGIAGLAAALFLRRRA